MSEPSPDPASVHELKRYVLEQYDQLHAAACRQMAHEQPDHSLQATALINEFVIKLLKSQTPLVLNNGDHFLAVATRMMQQILIDRARHKHTDKAGGDVARQEFQPHLKSSNDFVAELLIIKEELERLEKEDPLAAEVVRMRCQGYSIEEAAAQLKLPRTTAYGLWNFGRAWLMQRLNCPSS